MTRLTSVGIVWSLLALPAVLPAQDGSPPATSFTAVPGESWFRYADLAEAGWSEEAISAARAFADSVGSLSVMLIHGGVVVTAWGDLERQEDVASIAKPLQAALVGTAVDRGEIDLESTLADHEIDDLKGLTDRERTARVRDLLTMRSGVYHPAVNEHFARPLPERGSHAPGEVFFYYNWNVAALNTVYERATGRSFPRAFVEEIAESLGLQDFGETHAGLLSSPDVSQHASVLVRMSARDMARIGLLYLREGRWGEHQVVPAAWVRQSRQPHVEVAEGRYFGYHWWIPEGRLARYDAFSASGAGTQLITVVPALDMVFVHRAVPLGGGVNGLDAREILLRLLDARTGVGVARPRLVPLD